MKHFVFLWAIIINGFSCLGAPVLMSKQSEVMFIKNQDIYFLVDTNGQWTIDQVRSSRLEGEFKPMVKNIGTSRFAHWFRLELTVEDTLGHYILELEYPPLESIACYAPYNRKPLVSGAGIPFLNKNIQSHTHGFDLGKLPLKTIIFLRIKAAAFKLPVRLYSKEDFEQHIFNSFIFFSLVTGIFWAIIAVNLGLFVRFLNYTNLLYSVYAFLLWLTLMSDAGLAHQYLWPESPWWNAKSLSFLTICVGVSHIGFAMHLLNVKRYSLFFFWVCVAVMVCYTMLAAYILVIANGEGFKLAVICLSLLFFLGVAAIIICYINGDKPVRYYFFGWISLIGIVAVSFLKYLGKEPIVTGINYASSIGSLVEIIFFASAIGIKVKQDMEERGLLKEYLKSPANEPEKVSLSEREKEVMALISEGLKDKEIAERLHLSVPTVKTHARTLFKKLGVKSRLEVLRKSI